jgi:membrane protease YdiL (CAAX protease family)
MRTREVRGIERTTLDKQLRGTGALGVVAVVIVLLAGEIVSAVLVLAWAWITGTPWHKLGFVASPNWWRDVAFGVVGGVLLKFTMKALIMPALGFPPINEAYRYLAGNAAALPGMLFMVFVGAGFGEELVWRGFLFERLRAAFGDSQRAILGGLIVTSVLFGLAHYQSQGVAGATQATMTGLVFGSAYLLTGRIWPVMIAHAAFDVAAVLMIYWGLELPIAHAFLR